MGFGLMYLPAIVMVGFYFERKRALATGIAVCGSGIGAFVFAPLSERLLFLYGWKGATWIIAAIVLHGIIMGVLFRPLEVAHQAAELEKMELQEISAPAVSAPLVPSPVDAEPRDFMQLKMRQHLWQQYQNGSANTTQSQEDAVIHSAHNITQRPPLYTRQESNRSYRSADDIRLQADEETNAAAAKKSEDLQRPLYRKDIFYSGSLHHLPEYQSNLDTASYIQNMTSIPKDSTSGKAGLCSQCISLTHTLREMMDFSLLKNPVFCIYGISCFLCMGGKKSSLITIFGQ